MDKSSGLSSSFVCVLSSISLSGPCGISYISCSGAGNMLTSVLLVRQMWFPKYLQYAILFKLRLSLESLWFAFKNCLQCFIILITWIFIIYLQIYLDECCVQLCAFRKLSLLCIWMSKKKNHAKAFILLQQKNRTGFQVLSFNFWSYILSGR